MNLRKEERLCSQKLIDSLFNNGKSRSLSAFPVRAVYMCTPSVDSARVKMMVSVPKRLFKRAVKRNRIKRQLREAYRKNKQLLDNAMQATDQTLLVAFIWLSDRLYTSSDVEERVKTILQRINEKEERMRDER